MKGQDQMANSNPTNSTADTDYTVNETVKTTEHHVGDTVDFDSKTDRDVTGQFDDRVKTLVNGMVEDKVDSAVSAAMQEREIRENIRANHRNKNRLLTLAGAILIGIIVTYFFQNDGFPILGITHVLPAHLAVILYGYSFVVTVTLDASLALYSYVKHY